MTGSEEAFCVRMACKPAGEVRPYMSVWLCPFTERRVMDPHPVPTPWGLRGACWTPPGRPFVAAAISF